MHTGAHPRGSLRHQRNPGSSGLDRCSSADFHFGVPRANALHRWNLGGHSHGWSCDLASDGGQALLDAAAGGAALVAIVGESLLGNYPILHALLAPLLFALMTAIALFTSNDWAQGPDIAEHWWQPSLRSLAVLMPILVLMQIALGAAYRHNAMSVLWHILNALIVLLFILVVGVAVMRQYPEHRSLRPAALALVVITSTQVLLGFAVFLVLIISSGNNIALVVSSVAHVVTGSLTLAATVVVVIQIRRHLCDVARPPDTPPSE